MYYISSILHQVKMYRTTKSNRPSYVTETRAELDGAALLWITLLCAALLWIALL